MQWSFESPFTHRPLANLSLHEKHADMEALSTRGMGQAEVFCRQQSFKLKIK